MRWIFRVISMLLLLPVCSAVSRADDGFSLEDILAVAYPTELATASQADRVVWVLNDRGVRNVWTASDAEDAPRKLTAYEEDDGQPIGGLAVTSDGELVVYVRGGGANQAGEHPNPTSDPAGADQMIWAVATAGGEPWSLGLGSSPVLSPSGDTVVFRREDGLYQAPLRVPNAEQPIEAKLLIAARGSHRGAVFSPLGDRLAFVSDRDDHSFIGVYDFGAETLRWMAPSVDRDDFPAWSADGERLAFIRRDGAVEGEVFNFLISWPFRILVASLDGGSAEEVWRSSERGGGFAQIYPSRPLRWAGDRLVFYSEDSGWMHIHSLSLGDGSVIDLTPGECEAEHSDVDPAGEWLVFSHNCDDIDRRQVARVPIGGGEAGNLTPVGGVTGAIHTRPRFAAAGARVYLRSSDALRPTVVARVDAAGRGYRRVQESAWPGASLSEELIVPSLVYLTAADGTTTHAQLFEPAGGRLAAGRPAVVFMHGGPMRQMLLGWHYMEYYSRCYAFNQYLASRGWVVLSVNYRSGIGYGQDFRLAPAQGPYGAAEYQDVLAAASWLAQHVTVNASRIALWGGSYGGYLTALGLARNSDIFAAGVDLHGVHDWAFRATDFTKGGGWGIVGEEAMELALASSPAADLSGWTSPVLLVHGDDDRNVLFQQTTDLAVRLRRQGVEPEILVLPDEVHGFLRHQSWLTVFEAAAEFLERQVKKE